MSDSPTRASDKAQAEPEYLVPKHRHRTEDIISRSRFITTLNRARSASEAHAFFAEVREEFPDATHNCWAFIAGPPGSSASVGMSDDGEPHGTAGRPMLHTLTHGDIGEVAAVCTRYYGGTKLGTGGLARAYSGGVAATLESQPTILKVDQTTVEVHLPYEAVDSFERLQARFSFTILERNYDVGARYLCLVPRRHMVDFKHTLSEITRGSASVAYKDR